MSEQEIKKEIQNMVQMIVAQYEPEKIILFGSYAWGKPDKTSDVDFFIVKDTKKERRFRAIDVSGIIKDRKIPTDILVYTPPEVKKRLNLGDFFVRRIFSEGKLLYEKK